jgi:hypothetical protein
MTSLTPIGGALTSTDAVPTRRTEDGHQADNHLRRITPFVPANITISSKSDAIQTGPRSAGYRTGIITCS